MTRQIQITLLAFIALATTSLFAQQRPNIVLIMADDMGYSDIGCYGGEINTPNINTLAKGGVRFSQFYNAGRCCPTRASLMTGLYPHEAGIGHMVYADRGAGYRPHLNRNCVTIAEVLRRAGYQTMMTGKWHVGHQDGNWPTDRGFDKFYGIHIHVDSYFKVLRECPIYHDDQLVIPETENPPNTLHPDQPWYSTDVFTDWAIKFLDDAPQEKPFFLYVAYNSPHWPLEAPNENIANYSGNYETGWDQLRQRRLDAMKAMGLVNANTQLPPSGTPAWTELSTEDRQQSAFRREIYAAQVERMDHNIGRIYRKLFDLRKIRNTLILFLSDNGCSAEQGMLGYKFQENKRENFANWRAESRRSSSIGEAWATASNTPFRLHKRFVHEGGIATPLIAHWPDGFVAKGKISHQAGHVVDIMATCVDVAGAQYPNQFDGNSIRPPSGRSLRPALDDPNSNRQRTLFWEHEKHSAVRIGDWKLVSLDGSNDKAWELYDFSKSRSETHNVAANHPDRVAELKATWNQWATKANVLPFAADRQRSDSVKLRKPKDSIEPPLELRFSKEDAEHWSFHGGNWNFDGTMLTGSGVSGPRALLNNFWGGDYRVTTEIKVHDPDGQAGIICRTHAQETGTNAYHGYYIGFRPGQGNLMLGASVGRWLPFQRYYTPLETGLWYRITVELRGNLLRGWIAKAGDLLDTESTKPHVEAIDKRFKRGGIGFRTLGGTASFRNTKVTPLE